MATTNTHLATPDVIQAAIQCAATKSGSNPADVVKTVDMATTGGILDGYTDLISVYFEDGMVYIVSRNLDGEYRVEMSGKAYQPQLSQSA